MRALRLCGLTLAVAAAHLVAWRIAVGGAAPNALARAGVHWIAAGTSARLIVASAASAPTYVSNALPALAAAPPGSADAAPAIGARDTPTSAPGRWSPPDAAMPVPVLAPPRPPARPATPAVPTTRRARAARAAPAGRAAPPVRAATSEASTSAATVRAGDDGTARRAAARAPRQALYATRVPPSTSLRYALVQGDARSPAARRGSAALDWTHDAATFTLRVATAPGRQPAREWVSTGTFDAAGVAPIRLAERERGRDKRALNIDRGRDGGRVRFSGATQALPLAPGTQDRWSWIAQLAAIAEAASTAPGARVRDEAPPGAGRGVPADARHAPARRIPVGTTWAFDVAGLRGELEHWVFRVVPGTDLPGAAGATRNGSSDPVDRAPALLHVVREPERPYDLRIEAWLSPALHHLPIGLRMSTPPGGWSLALWPPAEGGDAPASTPSAAGGAGS